MMHLVIKKQNCLHSRTWESIDNIGWVIRAALEKLQSGNESSWEAALTELKTELKDAVPLTQLEGTQKELNVALSKYVKLLEKSLKPWHIEGL